DAIGFPATVLAWIASVLAGGFLIKRQGLEMLSRLQDSVNSGVVPEETVWQGLCLLVAGLLLVMPGFISDVIAFFLMFPIIRTSVRRYGVKNFVYGETGREHRPPEEGEILDGVYRRTDDIQGNIPYSRDDRQP
ncbi:MAG: hypothetical protein DI626_10185, partial [Micavibrio aeruginosavorus]